jgi:integron integrase
MSAGMAASADMHVEDPSETAARALRPIRLLDQVREAIRYRHYSYRTEQAYVEWARRYVIFHDKRHPSEMGETEVAGFLTHLATERDVSASTHQQALSALLFLYRNVLSIELPWLGNIVRPKKPRRLPVVLSRDEVQLLLAQLEGTPRLMGRLLYGTGMRIMECLRLRVKDLDLRRGEIVVRHGKGGRDRVTMAPRSLTGELTDQLARARVLWAHDRATEVPAVELPFALDRKYPKAGQAWGWFWVFPAPHLSEDPRSGITRRHHAYEETLTRAIKRAVRASGIPKPATAHTLRHYLPFLTMSSDSG